MPLSILITKVEFIQCIGGWLINLLVDLARNVSRNTKQSGRSTAVFYTVLLQNNAGVPRQRPCEDRGSTFVK
jgi:hypothetical protein